MEERDGMVFYRSFYEAVEDLPPDEFKASVCAILDYGIRGIEPSAKGVAKSIYIMAKPQIDKNNQRYLNGKMGGRKNQTETKPEPNDNQTITKPEPKEKDKVKDKVKEKEDINIVQDARSLFERLWKIYPNKKGKGQVSDTQKKRLLAIGEPALVKAIERYSTELQKDADWRKPQNGSTFFNKGYVDYLGENYVPGKETPRKKNSFNNFNQRQYDFDELEKSLLS